MKWMQKSPSLTLAFIAPVVAYGLLIGSASRATAITLLPAVQYSQGYTTITVPGSTGYETLQTPVTGPGTITTSAAGFGLGTAYSAQATITTSLAPIPSATAIALVAAPNGYPSATAGVVFNYTVEIIGPAGLVPVDVQATGSATSTTNAGSSASLSLSNISNVPILEVASSQGQALGGFVTSLNISNTYEMTADSPFSVQITDEASAGIDPILTASSASASIDPLFFIDPSDPNASEYSILLSPGVGNAPAATPLPAAFPLFATSLGGLGLLGWRRKRKTAVIAA